MDDLTNLALKTFLRHGDPQADLSMIQLATCNKELYQWAYECGTADIEYYQKWKCIIELLANIPIINLGKHLPNGVRYGLHYTWSNLVYQKANFHRNLLHGEFFSITRDAYRSFLRLTFKNGLIDFERLNYKMYICPLSGSIFVQFYISDDIIPKFRREIILKDRYTRSWQVFGQNMEEIRREYELYVKSEERITNLYGHIDNLRLPINEMQIIREYWPATQ